MKRIYLDHAAATPLDKKVAAFIEKSQSIFGNASSLHARGREAKKLLEESRKKVAGLIGASAPEIIFTSSGTESVNLAVLGVARAQIEIAFSHDRDRMQSEYKNKQAEVTAKGHIITTKIEHLSVLKTCGQLERWGFDVTYLDVQPNGIVNPELVKKALRPDTILVSVMYANNEIGTIQPVAKIAKVVRNFEEQNSTRILFHTDACQAAGALDLNVQKLGVDLMTLNGSKIYGPKGTGCLFVRRGVNIEPLLFGGSQEMGRRAGTENAPLLAGFAIALELADKTRIKESARLIKLRDYLISKILKTILPIAKSDRGSSISHPNRNLGEIGTGLKLNGDPVLRLPNNINISFPNSDGEMLVLTLDQKGIEVSAGSACTTAETGLSHVLEAIGVKDGNLRITLGRSTTKKDLDYFLKVLPGVIKKLK